MTKFATSKNGPVSILIGLALSLGGCHTTSTTKGKLKSEAAAMTGFVDVSASTLFITSPAYTDAAIKRVGGAVMKHRLGDTFRLFAFGNRSADNAVDVLSVASGYSHRLPAVRKQVETTLEDLTARNRMSGGEGSTDILYALQNAHPICTPGSDILILSDGIAEDQGYSASRALAVGQPVHLPPPGTPYLTGCSVEMIGIGMAPQGGTGQTAQTLPDDQLQRLTAGWRDYLRAAGVRPKDMTFTSII